MKAFRLIAPLLLLPLLAGTPATAPDKTPVELKSAMHVFLSHLLALQPYMASDKAFGDRMNAGLIEDHLKALGENAHGLRHFEKLRTPGFAVSAAAMQDHVLEMRQAFAAGRKEYARWMLNETVEGCISCHSQLPASKISLVIDPQTLEGTSLERADFLFATRQFDAALALYTEIIADFRPLASATTLDDGELAETALRRKLAIYLRVRRDPAGAARSLEKDRGNELLPPSLRDAINGWIVELRRPGLAPAFAPATATRAELETYTQRILKDDLKGVHLFATPARAASYLMLSGVLYEALATPHEGLSASEILHWLATCDRMLNRDFFFSLSDLYLQECIHRAPHTPVAAACFADFQQSVELAYTGSRGTDIPDDVSLLLRKLKALAR